MAPRYQPLTLGTKLRERRFGWFTLAEALYEPGVVLRPHVHRHPAMTIVLRGSFGFGVDGETLACHSTGVLFELGEVTHSTYVGRTGLNSLIVEIIPRDRARLAEPLPLPRRHLLDGHPRTLSVAAEMAREFSACDSASALAVEGLVLELLAQVSRASVCATRPCSAPRWLQRVVERIHNESDRGLGLAELAAEVNVHPAHLARTFRRHYACSPGEYLRRRRLAVAADALRRSDRPICDVALSAGFYDQAHFTRCFRRHFGTTPAAYRRARMPGV